MTRRAIVRGIAGVVAAILIAIALPPVLRRLSVFQVRRVELTGLHYLPPDAVMKALGLRAEASIFDPARPLEARLLRVRGIARAAVSRRLPGTLEVKVTERPPVALAPDRGRLALVDRAGRPLPYDPTRGVPDLPLAERDTAVLGVIDRVREADPALYAALVAGRRERNTVVLETANRRLLVRVGATARELRGLAIVMEEAVRRRLRAAELDARFEGRVIVRGVRRT